MLEVQLLGKFEVTRDDQPIKIPSRQAQSLLAYLILNIGASHRREKLAGLLWPDFSEANARSNLRQTLWRLRRAIGDAYFMADKVSIGFACNNNCKFDVAILADEAAEARSPDELVSIVSVYKGRLLPGFYDDWVLLERERLQAVFESRMQLLLKRLIEEERWQEVRDWAERWISLGQVPEPAYRALMLAHAGLGDQASLASVYQRCIDVLNTELGVEPARETRELYLRLIRSEKPSQVNLEAPIGPSRVVEAGHPTSNLDRALEQEIRFCTSPDGVRLAYATVGQGPALVRAATYLTHLEYDWNSPVWRHWLAGLAEHHTLVRYDQRGCGLSDWEIEDFSLAAEVQDMETVVDTVGLDRFALLGISHSGPVVIAYAVRHPEKVSHLILYGSFARGFLKRDPTPTRLEEGEMFLKLIKIGWGRDNPTFRRLYSTMFLPEGTPEQISWFNDLQRISTSRENAVRRDSTSYNLDVSDLATRLTVPTLVIHARDDQAVPFAEGRHLATLIPKARLVSLDSKNHILLASEPAWPRFLTEVHKFIATEES